MSNHLPTPTPRPALWLLTSLASALLVSCGGGGDSGGVLPELVAQDALGTRLVATDYAAADTALGIEAQATFHSAPVLLEAPGDSDALDASATAQQPPRQQTVPLAQAGLATRQLTVQSLQSASRMHTLSAPAAADGRAAPMAAGTVVATYSPAQIRAAYGLPALPAAGTALSATQAAQLGAGQTIYIVNAQHNPNAAAELSAFNQKFGLPACTARTFAAGSALPLAAASKSACELVIAYSTTTGTTTNTAPGYNAGWATEIALDVQWAHATAPLARIVLIEAPDAAVNSLAAAVKLANAMGPGVVSMSFGAAEGAWTASMETAFAGAGMSYLAATGDSGAAVSWPAVSPKVLAVGGTTLSYNGANRSEVGWSNTGGGVSAFTSAPSYQTVSVPGLGSVARRSVADVAFNADPSTGQYVAVMTPGSSAVNWISAGGTSLSTPQWAGLLAVANAQRTLAGNALLATPHALVYGTMASVPGTYAATFNDITSGRNGTCSNCAAKAGYDAMTGLGTPNASYLLSGLANGTVPVTPPTLTGATIAGKLGTALSFNVNASAGNALVYSLTGAPSGMAISATGQVDWATPVVGNYAFTVTARDSKTNQTASAVFTVQIVKPGPTIAVPSLNGVAGKAMSGTIAISDPGATSLTMTVSGTPSGMKFSTSGLNLVASWANPVTGSYSLKLTVVDNAGLSATAAVPVTITAK